MPLPACIGKSILRVLYGGVGWGGHLKKEKKEKDVSTFACATAIVLKWHEPY